MDAFARDTASRVIRVARRLKSMREKGIAGGKPKDAMQHVFNPPRDKRGHRSAHKAAAIVKRIHPTSGKLRARMEAALGRIAGVFGKHHLRPVYRGNREALAHALRSNRAKGKPNPSRADRRKGLARMLKESRRRMRSPGWVTTGRYTPKARMARLAAVFAKAGSLRLADARYARVKRAAGGRMGPKAYRIASRINDRTGRLYTRRARMSAALERIGQQFRRYGSGVRAAMKHRPGGRAAARAHIAVAKVLAGRGASPQTGGNRRKYLSRLRRVRQAASRIGVKPEHRTKINEFVPRGQKFEHRLTSALERLAAAFASGPVRAGSGLRSLAGRHVLGTYQRGFFAPYAKTRTVRERGQRPVKREVKARFVTRLRGLAQRMRTHGPSRTSGSHVLPEKYRPTLKQATATAQARRRRLGA